MSKPISKSRSYCVHPRQRPAPAEPCRSCRTRGEITTPRNTVCAATAAPGTRAPQRRDDLMNRGTPADPELAELRRLAAGMSDRVPVVGGVSLTEASVGGVPVLRCRPESAGERVLLWFHGGAYRLGSAHGFRSWTSHLARACAAEVVAVDYRIAPEHPFPDALIDALLACEAIRGEGRPVLVGGESAGGGLAAALLLVLAARGLPRPAGAILLSPWLDLRVTAASFAVNAASDALFSAASARAAAATVPQRAPADRPAGIASAWRLVSSAADSGAGEQRGGPARRRAVVG